MKDLLTQISNRGVKNVDGKQLAKAFSAAGVETEVSKKYPNTTLVKLRDRTLEIQTNHTVHVNQAIIDAANVTLALKAHASRNTAVVKSAPEARL